MKIGCGKRGLGGGGRGGEGGEKVYTCMYIHGCSEFASHYASLSWCHGVLNAGRQLLVSTSAVQASSGFSEHLPSSLPSPRSLQPYHDL